MKYKNNFAIAAFLWLLITILLTNISSLGLALAESPASSAFTRVWAQTDNDVKYGKVSRGWFWGPAPNITLEESYSGAASGSRLVQYYDKARMEINSPSSDSNDPYFVTNGLLARELVSGFMQTGDNLFERRNPAQIPVGGDPDNTGATYATFTNLSSLDNDHRVEQRSGFVTQTINRSGQVGTTTLSANLAHYAYYSSELGHNIPDVFVASFQDWKASINLDWVYVLGLPISEPYWSSFAVNGTEKEVLVQLFERRALTYTPGNPAGFTVEMGNIGQHYYQWRYSTKTQTAAAKSPTKGSALPTLASDSSPNRLGTDEARFLELINNYRTQNGLGTVKVNPNLTNAASWMSTDMASKNYFGHTDSLGRDPFKRIASFGFTQFPQAENIAAGFQTADQVIQGWKTSPGHNTNMLGKDYTFIGISRAFNSNSTYKWYWTTDFGGGSTI